MMTSISEKTRGLPLRSNSSSVADCVDPSELTLVDVEIVRLLNACEKGSVELLHCWLGHDPEVLKVIRKRLDDREAGSIGNKP